MKALINGSVWLGNRARSMAQAVAFDGGQIVAVGSTAEIAEMAGSDVIDMEGRFLLPGFQDAHVHPMHGGLQRLQCDLSGCANAEEALATIADYVAANPKIEFIQGGGWMYPWFEGGNPSAAALDAVTGGRPAYLVVADGHSGWANSAALALAGLDASSSDPVDGRIERLGDGSPQGTLHEGAMNLVEAVTPDATAADIQAGLMAGQEALFSFGITAWQDAWVTSEIHQAYRSLAQSGDLLASVRGALWWDREQGLEQLESIVEMSSQGVGRYVPKSVKLMLDGVCENFTASMLDAYLDGEGAVTENRGIDFIDPGALGEIVTQIDAAGLQCHFHALGDRAVRSALDAIAVMREANGWSDLRPHLAHLQVVSPQDIPRFRRLGAAANAQPLWACPEPALTELTLPFLQEPQQVHQYPFASLLAAGATMAMGSDWPVSTPDVMAQVAVAATRSVSGETLDDSFLADQKLAVTTALAAFTSGTAYVNHLENETGVIAPGYRADLVLLDQDPFEVAWVGDVAVELTLAGGEIVYQRSS